VASTFIALPITAAAITGPIDITINPSGDSVEVTNFPASQAVTGPLTDAQLRAVAVPVSGTLTANPTIYATKVDEVSGTVTYVGKAAVGSGSASAVWQISKLEQSGAVLSVTYADGNANFDNVWNDRAGLSYS
jgi:hypothetical protein